MKKKLALILLSAITAVCCAFGLSACGDSSKTDAEGNTKNEYTQDLEYILNEEQTAYVVSGIGTAKTTDIVIADEFNDKKVISINDYAFSNCKRITSVTIGNNITSIGIYAFSNCEELASVTISDSVTSIGGGAFNKCYNLESVVMGNGVTKIGADAFYNCGSITSITIPDKVTSIGGGAFYGCSHLTSVIIPYGVSKIDEYTFEYCSSLTSITIPSSVTIIDGNALMWCSDLTTIAFQGSKKQWNAISKGWSWDACTGEYTVKCSDGNIAKDW